MFKWIKNLFRKQKEVKTRDIQTIFNVMIDKGFYNQHESFCMCLSLGVAHISGVITLTEYTVCIKSIDRYLGNYSFLRTYLQNKNLPSEFEDRIKIYENWSERP